MSRYNRKLTKVSCDEFGFNITTKYTRWLFTSLGLWILITECFTILEKYISIIAHIICEFLMFFVIIPSFYYLLWSNEDFKIKIAIIGPIGVCIICAFKYYSIIRHRKHVKNCLEQIKMDWKKIDNYQDWNIMIQNVHKGNKVTIIFAIFMFTGGISHQAAAPFLSGSLISILKNSSDRPLVFPVAIIDSIFNPQSTPVYEIIYLLHILMGAVVCTMSVGACNLGAILVTHICGQIQIIIIKLENLVKHENNKNDDVRKKIHTIVQLHNDVIKFSWNIQKIMGEICLIEMVGATVIICVDEYYCLMAWEYNERAGFIIYLTLFFAFTFNVFIFCYIGELMKNEFNRVGESIYMSNWHYLPPKRARDFIVILTVAQNPIKLSANGFIEMSCSGFTKVMKTTVTFFNILRMIEL